MIHRNLFNFWKLNYNNQIVIPMIYWNNFTIIYNNATRKFVAYTEHMISMFLELNEIQKVNKVFYTNDAFNLLTQWYIFVT